MPLTKRKPRGAVLTRRGTTAVRGAWMRGLLLRKLMGSGRGRSGWFVAPSCSKKFLKLETDAGPKGLGVVVGAVIIIGRWLEEGSGGARGYTNVLLKFLSFTLPFLFDLVFDFANKPPQFQENYRPRLLKTYLLPWPNVPNACTEPYW